MSLSHLLGVVKKGKIDNSLSKVIRRHFWMKRVEIMDQCQRWIHEMEAQGSDRRTGRTVAVNCQALKVLRIIFKTLLTPSCHPPI